jgi:hypothetical protein
MAVRHEALKCDVFPIHADFFMAVYRYGKVYALL